MARYHNIIEILAERYLNEIWEDTDGCKCEDCRSDIMAITLNNIKPKYVSSTKGEVFSRAEEYNITKEVEIISELTKAIQIVNKNPRHDSDNPRYGD